METTLKVTFPLQFRFSLQRAIAKRAHKQTNKFLGAVIYCSAAARPWAMIHIEKDWLASSFYKIRR